MDHPTPAVTISARREGFRRCGVEHPALAVPYEAGHWSAEELELLRATPELVVVEHGEDAPPAPAEVYEAAFAALRAAPADEVAQFFEAAAGDPDIATPAPKPAVPATPTREAALAFALDTLRAAPAVDVQEFVVRMKEDPEIWGKAMAGADPDPDPEAKPDPEPTREERLVAAIAKLEQGNDSHWTKSGKPEVRALGRAAGLEDVRAAERNTAWAAFKAGNPPS